MSLIYYTGIGSRSTPVHILDKMEEISFNFAKCGRVLRSGGAIGADSAFEKGCLKGNGNMEIFLPWKQFRAKEGRQTTPYDIVPKDFTESKKMFKELVLEYKDFNLNAPNYIWNLMARNMYQILGQDLKTPSSLVVCYTPEGKDIGGTRWALRLARKHKIPIYNVGARL